jgi:polyphosphate kinase 2
MSKKTSTREMPKAEYRNTLYRLRVQLAKLQNEVIRKGLRVLVVLEGRDGAGKDGAIKRMTKTLSPRETRVVALGKPSGRDEGSWYFRRFVPYFPMRGEIVVFNRSWYNRAGVEVVMGFCTKAEHAAFLEDVPGFEALQVRSGTLLRKYYLDIGKAEQHRRLAARRRDPLTQWKVSPIDSAAAKHWHAYSSARDEMFAATHSEVAPWVIVRTDDKRTARLSFIKALLASVDYRGKDEALLVRDPDVVFRYDTSGKLAR